MALNGTSAVLLHPTPVQLKNARQHARDIAETARPFRPTAKNVLAMALGAAGAVAIAAGRFWIGAGLAAVVALLPLWRVLLLEPALRAAWAGSIAGLVAGASVHLPPETGRGLAPDSFRQLTVFALVGTVVGGFVGTYPSDKRLPAPQTIIKEVGASFALIFAIGVTLRFYGGGLKAARDLGSTLSTLLTVVLVTLFVPVWVVDHACGVLRRRAQTRTHRPGAV